MNNEINSRVLSIKEGRVPLGYKKTKVGIIPNDWAEKNLSDLIEELETGISVNSYDFKANIGQKAVLKTSCVSNGKFNSNENKVIIEKEVDRAKLNPKSGEIIISRMNTPQLVGEIGYVDKDYPELFLPDRLWQSKLYKNVDGKWLAESLITEKIKYQIKDIATGTSNSMKNISKSSFLAIKVPFTRYEEQKKIAGILGLWDKSIELQEQLLQEKQKQKKGLMERLLTGKIRLNGFNKEWKEIRLSNVLAEENEITTINNQYPVLTSSRQGLFLQSEYFKKQVASQDNVGYKIIKNGEFTYRAMSDDGKFTFNQLLGHEIGIVSPAYSVFKVKDNSNEIFIKEILNSDVFTRHLAKEVQGGTRLSLKFKSLSKIKIKIPEKKEQSEIAKVLKLANDELELLQKEIDLLKEQKKGLMQLLLTGIVRVKCY